MVCSRVVVSYWNSTSNHNVPSLPWRRSGVVSYWNSTSNHNCDPLFLAKVLLYLIEILHQTTTLLEFGVRRFGCILLKFYIKPQPRLVLAFRLGVVSYWNSTSNHNCWHKSFCWGLVVSYWNSTSNHNDVRSNPLAVPVVSYWNSTSNHNVYHQRCYTHTVVSYWNSTSNHNICPSLGVVFALYLIEILHQTTTIHHRTAAWQSLYLIEILHQTTTVSQTWTVSLTLYLIEILHQTTTDNVIRRIRSKLYLIEILHQTTTTYP